MGNSLMSGVSGDYMIRLGFRTNDAFRAAMAAAEAAAEAGWHADQIKARLRQVAEQPHACLEGIFGEAALALSCARESWYDSHTEYHMNPHAAPYEMYGAQIIDGNAREQMETAMRLPVALAGALMPDAHLGFGLPIGGVLATPGDIVLPYAVGTDIACRMCLTVFDAPARRIRHDAHKLTRALKRETMFGWHARYDEEEDHEVFDRPEWREIPWFGELRRNARRQLGSSGKGNHFVEWGELRLAHDSEELGLKKGEYIALLSHSGSRGLGATISEFYSGVARDLRRLPGAARPMAWLSLREEAGQEYWAGMQLAGAYAEACHELIHRRLAEAMGYEAIARVENHHNFAWKETLPDGTEAIIHRKGATPAGKGVLGVIPGSAVRPAYVVSGRGHAGALSSASHGAGRVHSRGKAKAKFTRSHVEKVLKQHQVTMIGGSTEEAPMAYKPIKPVMEAQTELVRTLAEFQPRIVRMAGAGDK